MDLYKIKNILKKNLYFDQWSDEEYLEIFEQYCNIKKELGEKIFFISRSKFNGRLGNQIG